MSDERTELLEKANELGIEFPSNVKTEKLKVLIADSEGPALKSGETQNVPDNETVKDTGSQEGANTPAKNGLRPLIPLSKRIAEAKKRATKKHIVTITNKDSRENDVMTTVSLSFENAYFGISRNVPLDIPVELEQALIDIAESTLMTLHKEEILDGRRTGNKVATRVKKFAISYGRPTE